MVVAPLDLDQAGELPAILYRIGDGPGRLVPDRAGDRHALVFVPSSERSERAEAATAQRVCEQAPPSSVTSAATILILRRRGIFDQNGFGVPSAQVG